MPRIRSVHPEICDDVALSAISANAERTYVRLWTHLDDEGRAEDRPKLLAARLYPEHDDMGPAEVERDLAELETAGLLIRYEAEGKRILTAKPSAWKKFQKPRHPTASKLPPMPETSAQPTDGDGKPTEDVGSVTAESGKAPAGVVGGEGVVVGEELTSPNGLGEEKRSRRASVSEQVAYDVLEPAEQALRENKHTPLECYEAAYTQAFTAANETEGADALAAARTVLGRYFRYQTDRDPEKSDWGLMGRLVKSYGLKAFAGFHEGITRHPEDWFRYARGVCQKRLEEVMT